MDVELLKEIGLTDGEIKVYLALFKLGPSSTGPIVKESKVHSSKVYPILDRLIDKGLVSFIKEGKKTIYTANPPDTILSFLDKKRTKIEEQKKSAKGLVKELELMKTIETAKTEATVFKGVKGLKTAYRTAVKDVKKGDLVYEMFLPPVKDPLVSFFINHVKSISKSGIKQRMLFNETCREATAVEKFPRVTVKYISQEFISPTEICVYGDNTVISTTAGKEYVTFLVKNKEIADSFKTQFNYIWNQDVHVTYGMKALTDAHEKTYKKVKPGEEYVYLGIPKFQPEEQHEYWKKDHEKRAKLGIKTRMLFNKDTDKEVLKNRNTYKDGEARFMPTNIKTPAYFNIYKDTVMIALPKKDPIVIEIVNQEIADSFKAYFEEFWKRSKKFK